MVELDIKLPNEPTEELLKIIKESKPMKRNVILYKKVWLTEPITGLKYKMVKCTCTACGTSYYLMECEAGGCGRGWSPAPYGVWINEREKAISGECVLCENCGEQAELLYSGNMRYGEKRIDEACYSELRKVDGKACVLTYLARLYVTENAALSVTVHPWEAYVISVGRMYRFTGYRGNMRSGISLYGRYEQRQQYSDEWGQGKTTYIPKGVFDGTEAENSRAEIIAKQDTWIVSYLHKWLKTPVLEAIVESGGEKLIAEALNANAETIGYTGGKRMLAGILPIIKNKKEKRPAQAMGLTKEQYRWAIDDKWPSALVTMVAEASAAGIRWKRDDMKDIMRLGDSRTRKAFENYGEETPKICRYLKKQEEKHKGEAHLCTVLQYIDYREALKANGEDLPENRYPRDLPEAHDRETEKRRLVRDRETDAKIAARAEKMAALSWQKDGLIIRPARSTGELIEEGKRLHHCVGGYGQSVAEGKATILFIRREAEPEESFYTLQLDEIKLTVVQNHGDWNKLQTDEVMTFERAWIEHIKRDLVREKDGTWEKRKEIGLGDNHERSAAS